MAADDTPDTTNAGDDAPSTDARYAEAGRQLRLLTTIRRATVALLFAVGVASLASLGGDELRRSEVGTLLALTNLVLVVAAFVQDRRLHGRQVAARSYLRALERGAGPHSSDGPGAPATSTWPTWPTVALYSAFFLVWLVVLSRTSRML